MTPRTSILRLGTMRTSWDYAALSRIAVLVRDITLEIAAR